MSKSVSFLSMFFGALVVHVALRLWGFSGLVAIVVLGVFLYTVLTMWLAFLEGRWGDRSE